MNVGQIQNEWTPNFYADGLTTLTWGTEGDGIVNYSSYIVMSYSEEDRIEEIDIEQGSGFEAIVILLNKGKNVKVQVVDDTAIAPPSLANNPLTISSPFSPNFGVLLVGRTGDAARKREGIREYTLKSFNAIPGLH